MSKNKETWFVEVESLNYRKYNLRVHVLDIEVGSHIRTFRVENMNDTAIRFANEVSINLPERGVIFNIENTPLGFYTSFCRGLKCHGLQHEQNGLITPTN